MDDLISRQAAIDALVKQMPKPYTPDGSHPADEGIFQVQEVYADCIETLELLPYVQPEVRPIDYQDCSNAMLKMWIDNVVTDREYNRIMNKLIVHWGKKDG